MLYSLTRQEFFVTVTRIIPLTLAHQTARQIVADLAHWKIHIPETSDLLQAIDLLQEYQLSFWEAMIVQSAAHQSCTRLISEVLDHGQLYDNVQVENPFIGII